MKYSLDNIAKLLKALGNPHTKLKFIHIAGTNGKGATASMIASILMEHGLNTGLFTSPHILKFNERIRVNGKCIPNGYIKTFLDDNVKLINKTKPSFFEVNTAMAFKYFADKKVEIAVTEAGLGGRLDSTNVIMPELSIITQIGMDHMQFLGNTIVKIAKEKLGIVKKGADVIVSDNNPELKSIFKSKIKKDNLYFIDKYSKISTVKTSGNGTKFTLNFKDKNESAAHKLAITSPLHGIYQARNAATAILAANKFLKKLKITFSSAKTQAGIRKVKTNTGYYGRFEKIFSKGINYIFDISHNPDGIKAALKILKDKKPDVIVFGIMSDKNYKEAVKEILKHSYKIIFTKPGYDRALAPEDLLQYSKQFIKKGQQVLVYKNVKETVKNLKSFVKKGETILFIGSFFLVSDAVKALKFQRYFK